MELQNEEIDAGVSSQGVHTKLTFEGEAAIVKKTFDATPHLKHAENARIQTAGQNWGGGKLVGHIPPVFYAQIMTIRDPQEREAAVMKFFRENPAFVMFDRFGKDL